MAAPTVAQQIASFPGSQAAYTTYQPGKDEDEEEGRSFKFLPSYPSNFKEYLRTAREAQPLPQPPSAQQASAQQGPQTRQAKQQQQQQRPSAGNMVGGALGQGVGLWAGKNVPSLFDSAGVPSAVSAPVSQVGMSTETGPVLVDVATGQPVASATGFPAATAAAPGSWAALGESTVGSGTAGNVAGGVVSAVGTYVAMHQGAKMMEDIKWGDRGDATKHGFQAGAGAGAAIGNMIAGPAGAVVGSIIGSVIGAIGGMIGASKTGKDKDQLKRDMVRDALQNGKLLDEKYNITLADGSKFDLGIDGHGKNFDESGYAYQVARTSPYGTQAVAWADTLAYTLMGGNKKLATDFAGYFANAAMSNAQDIETVRANFLTFIKNSGLTRQQIEESLKRQYEAGALSEEQYRAMLNSTGTLFEGRDYVILSWEQAEAQAGGGQVTDYNPAAVPAPHPNAPSRQEGPAINDLPLETLPSDLVLRVSNLYDYYAQAAPAAQTATPAMNNVLNEIIRAAQGSVPEGSQDPGGVYLPPIPPAPQPIMGFNPSGAPGKATNPMGQGVAGSNQINAPGKATNPMGPNAAGPTGFNPAGAPRRPPSQSLVLR